CQRGGQVPIPRGCLRPQRRRSHRPHALRQCRPRRHVPLPVARKPVHPHSRPTRRRAALAAPGQGSPARRHPEQRPRRVHGAQNPLPRRRRAGPHRSLYAAPRQGRDPEGGQGRHCHF
ncbi:hypothetical protein BN1708_019700, partial [Verticillium longisporum]